MPVRWPRLGPDVDVRLDGVETFAGPGQNFHQRIAILDVDGTRVLIETWTFDDTRPPVVADAFAVVDSIDFS